MKELKTGDKCPRCNGTLEIVDLEVDEVLYEDALSCNSCIFFVGIEEHDEKHFCLNKD